MILKIAVLAICVCVLSAVLKSYFKEAVLPLELAFAVVALALVGEKAKEVVGELWSSLGDSEIGSAVISALIKGALICIFTKLSCDIAKDSGNTLVSDIIDLTGRIMLIALCFPFLESVIETATAFLP